MLKSFEFSQRSKPVFYLTEEDIIYLFETSYLFFKNYPEPGYKYEDDKVGCKYFVGILEKIKLPYYKDVIDKAAYLFVEIANGHKFRNGNKRIAIISLLVFLGINGFSIRPPRSNSILKELIRNEWQIDLLEQDLLFTPKQNLLYVLALIAADKYAPISFKKLKTGVENILRRQLRQN